ncbi:MAG: hypothetical protein R2932_07030 [Caldilineaceae bacterium]
MQSMFTRRINQFGGKTTKRIAGVAGGALAADHADQAQIVGANVAAGVLTSNEGRLPKGRNAVYFCAAPAM